MKIMFEDLTYEAQVRLLDEAGVSSPVEMKWHIVPITVVNFSSQIPVVRGADLGDGTCWLEDDY
jgi:hypothetical protein